MAVAEVSAVLLTGRPRRQQLQTNSVHSLMFLQLRWRRRLLLRPPGSTNTVTTERLLPSHSTATRALTCGKLRHDCTHGVRVYTCVHARRALWNGQVCRFHGCCTDPVPCFITSLPNIKEVSRLIGTDQVLNRNSVLEGLLNSIQSHSNRNRHPTKSPRS